MHLRREQLIAKKQHLMFDQRPVQRIDDFEESTGLSVEVKYGNSADLALLIDEEGEASEMAADVFLSQSPGSMGFLEERGRLGAVPQSTLALVPDNVRDDSESWVGFSGRQRVLVYNTDAVDPADLPSSVFDMANPQWKGRVGVAPGNGSFQDFVTAMRSTQCDATTLKWLRALDANDPVLYANNSAIVAAVGRGEVDTGLVNHYYNYRALVENPDQPSANHLFATETFEYPLAIGESPANNVPPIDFSSDVSNAGALHSKTSQAGSKQHVRSLLSRGSKADDWTLWSTSHSTSLSRRRPRNDRSVASRLGADAQVGSPRAACSVC